MVFGFGTAELAVGHREIHQRKESSVLPHVELPCRRHFARDPVPPPGFCGNVVEMLRRVHSLCSFNKLLRNLDHLDTFPLQRAYNFAGLKP
jgi:hypothetical protein